MGQTIDMPYTIPNQNEMKLLYFARLLKYVFYGFWWKCYALSGCYLFWCVFTTHATRKYKQTYKRTNIHMHVHCTARKRGGDRDGTKSIMIMLVININICGQIHGRRMKRTRRFSQWDKLFLVEVLAYSNASEQYTLPKQFSIKCQLIFHFVFAICVYNIHYTSTSTSTSTHTHMHTRTKFSGFNTHVGCHLYTICFCFRLVVNLPWNC